MDAADADVYDSIPREFNAATRFVDAHLAAGRGARVAIVHEGRSIPYDEVAAQVNRAGNALLALGVQVEQRVLLALNDGPEFVYAFWGAIKIGAVPVPVNTRLAQRDYEYILRDTRAVLAVADAETAPVARAARRTAPLLRHLLLAGDAAGPEPRFAERLAAGSERLEAAPTTRDDAAFWLYSSGTTGTPKGVVHLQHDMVICCEAFGRHVLEIEPDDRCFSVAKLFFAYGLGNALYYPFYVGAATVLFGGKPDPQAVFGVVARTRPTLLFAVPTAFAAMLQAAAGAPRMQMPSVRRCLSAGEPLPAAVYERWRLRFGTEILDGIGSTEMCHTFIANRAGAVRPGSSGTLVPGYEARIVDDDGRDVAAGEIGNLLVRGESAAPAYWNQHRRSRDILGGAWVQTGDKYVRDGDGYFWYKGRRDDMIKAGGIWVAPAEVEGALAEHPAVLEAAVVAAPDADELFKPLAFVVLADGHAASPELEQELREFVRSRLAHFKCPRWIRFVPDLPKTATGKIRRFVLRERQ